MLLCQHSCNWGEDKALPESLTCLCVLEPHLLVLIFGFGRGPHGLEAAGGPVLAVCWRRNLCLLAGVGGGEGGGGSYLRKPFS